LLTRIVKPMIIYGTAGVAKHGAIKRNRCIAFTSQEEPSPKELELPVNNELPMRSGIRIVPKRRNERLSQISPRSCTIETNLKVYEYDADPQ
jgi:hypothetical protein